MRTNKKLEWRKLGVCGVDAGILMIGDPCYFIGKGSSAAEKYKNDWGEFIKQQCRYGKDESDIAQMNFQMGHSGLGVMASTRYGDGCYSVWGLFAGDEDTDRPMAMIVVTEDEDVCSELPPLPVETRNDEDDDNG